MAPPNASPARSLIGGDELLSQHAFGGRREKEKQNKSDAGLELRSEKFLETLKLLSADLTSTKWDTRLETVVRLEKIACATATANSSSGGTGWEADDQTVVALFDLIVPRLADGNAKVQTRTLECVTQLLPLMRDSTQAALSSLVPGLGGGLGRYALGLFSQIRHALFYPERARDCCPHVAMCKTLTTFCYKKASTRKPNPPPWTRWHRSSQTCRRIY